MANNPDVLRRDAFDSVAEAYDRARPSYPEQLVNDLIALADIGERSRVLEIGPGTGQLSVPLAKHGASSGGRGAGSEPGGGGAPEALVLRTC